MRPVIVFVVAGASCLAVGGGSFAQALAAEDSKDLPAAPQAEHSSAAQADITRVAIAVSGGSVAYTDQFRQDPPAIVIEFRSRNVIAALGSSVVINAGIIKEIQSEYYPKDRRALKSLTLTLIQPAAYAIAQQANQIVVDIETPAGVLPGRMAVGKGVTVLGIEAKETLIQRLKVMEGALQQVAPPLAPVSAKPKPVVVTKLVEIPQPIPEPKPVPMPGPKKGFRGFWLGFLLGIGGSVIAVAGWRRRRKAVVAPGELAEFASIAQSASVYEQLILKAVQRQGQKLIGSKAIAGLGTLWVIQKGEQRQGLVCLGDGGFLERKVLEQFYEALQQEALRSGSVVALGAFTAPAQSFAKEKEISLISREEVFKLMEVELKSAALVLDEETLNQQLAKPQGELVQAQERIKALEQELSASSGLNEKAKAELETKEREAEAVKKKWQEKEDLSTRLSHEIDQLKAQITEADQRLATEREEKAQQESQIEQLKQGLAEKDKLAAQISQELDRLKATTAQADQALAAEREKRSELEAQIGKLQEELKAQTTAAERRTGAAVPEAKQPQAIPGPAIPPTSTEAGEKERVAQKLTRLARNLIKEVAKEERRDEQAAAEHVERRQRPRLDLSRHNGKGVLIRATSNDGEPMNGDARNISAGGLCVELPSGERLADEFELKLFLPDRTKPIEAIGKFIWKGRGSRRRFEQLGLAFSAINASDQEAISQFVGERKPEPVTVG